MAPIFNDYNVELVEKETSIHRVNLKRLINDYFDSKS